MKNKGGDTTMDLAGIPGSVKDGIGVTKDSAQGGIKSRTQEGLGNLRSNVQAGVDSNRTNVKGGGIDSTRTKLQSGADDFRGSAQGSSIERSGDSWLDRAKARINEATDQMKDNASDIKDDITEE